MAETIQAFFTATGSLADWLVVVGGFVTLLIGGASAVVAYRGLRDQVRIATQALDDNRRAFAVANRPKLVIRRVVMLSDPDTGHTSFSASVDYANVGGTPAVLVECKLALYQSALRRFPADVPWDDMDASPPNRLIAPGQTLQTIWGTGETSFEDFAGYRNRTHHLFAAGRIRYSEPSTGTVRELGFCRTWNHETRRFERIDDPDFEYAD